MNRLHNKRWFPWLLRGVLVVAATAAYLPSFRGDFVFDDMLHIVHNENIRSLPALTPHLAWNTRPVIFLTLWLNYQIGELNVLGYHILNFAVHLIAGLTLFGLVRGTLKLPPLERRFAGGRADLLAFVVALLWLVHPLQTQAVTYIIQRCESMMGMFYLLCWYCVLRASQSTTRWPWHLGAILAGWLGMGCKEVMATAPFVILLYDRVFLSPSWAAVFRRRWFFYLSLVPALVWLVVSIGWRPLDSLEKAELASNPSAAEYLGSQPAVILHYLRLAILPDKLCFDYKWPAVQSWSDMLLPGLAVLGLFAASVVALFRRPRLGFAAFSCFLVLAPTSSFNPIADLAVEHRIYLPLAFLLLLGVLGFAWVIRRVVRRRQRRVALLAATALVLAAAWTTRTFVRNHVYSKPAALWTTALAHAPDNARAHNNLACYLTAAGDLEGALGQYRRAMELDPNFTLPYVNMASVLQRKGDLATGVSLLRQAMEIDPDRPLLHCNLAVLLDKQGNLEEAMVHCRRALELEPEYGRAHYKLGTFLSRQGKREEAIAHFLAALEKKPRDLGCNFRLAYAYQRLGQFDEAVKFYQRTLEISPGFAKSQRNLELCLAGKREGDPPSDEAGKKDAGCRT